MQPIAKLFELLAPYDCLQCGQQGRLVCQTCAQQAYQSLAPPVQPYPNLPPAVDQLLVGAVYKGVLQQLIHRYKFDRAKSVSVVLVDLLMATCPVVPSQSLITYIPTATSRIRQRGYDHAKVLADQFARRHGVKASKLLSRRGQQRQLGANRQQRLEQLDGAFKQRYRPLIAGRTIILIDDVLTTGASLQAAAVVLKRAQAKTVVGLVVAYRP